MSIKEIVEGYAPKWAKRNKEWVLFISTAAFIIPLTIWAIYFFKIDDLIVENADLKSQMSMMQVSLDNLRVKNKDLAQQIVDIHDFTQNGGYIAGTMNFGEMPPPQREITESLEAKLLETKTYGKPVCVYVDDNKTKETVSFANKIHTFLQSKGIPSALLLNSKILVMLLPGQVSQEGIYLKENDLNPKCATLLVHSQLQ
jgi:hypothetical protein